MRIRFILLFKLINRFGFIKGSTIFFKNSIGKKGHSVFRLRELSQPVTLRRSTSDLHTFYHIFLNLEYQVKIKFAPEFIIDCGANIGLATLYFKSIYPKAQIVAIEPDQANFEMLEKNAGKYVDIDCIKAGVWNKNALLKVVDEYKIGEWGLVCREVNSEDETTIKALSIGEIMRRYKKTEIDILKIDIETSEIELFSSNYEEWLPKTKMVIIELHDWLKKGCSRAFFTALLKYDFSVFHSGENVVAIRN